MSYRRTHNREPQEGTKIAKVRDILFEGADVNEIMELIGLKRSPDVGSIIQQLEWDCGYDVRRFPPRDSKKCVVYKIVGRMLYSHGYEDYTKDSRNED